MKKRILALAVLVLIAVFALCGCGEEADKKAEKTTAATEVITEAPTEATLTIDEEAAKEMVWADLFIQESAAENLTVKLENNQYIISFQWSGYDYQYTIDGVNADIVQILFDGEPLL